MAISENRIKVLDIVIKGLFGALIAAAVAYYGTTLQDQRATVQEENRQLQAAIELTSRQKDFDVDLSMRLFRRADELLLSEGQIGGRARSSEAADATIALSGTELPGHPYPSQAPVRKSRQPTHSS